MKLKTIKNRRNKSSKNEGNSVYAQKIALQKRGIFSASSPFSLTDGSGISLHELNRIRFTSKKATN